MEPLLVFMLIVVVLVAALHYFMNFNRLRDVLSHTYSLLDEKLQIRRDGILALVEIIKQNAAAENEVEVFDYITAACAAATSAMYLHVKIDAQVAVEQGYRRLLTLARKNSQVMADNNFHAKQTELHEFKKIIGTARRLYNSVAKDYNDRIHAFPTNLVALISGFSNEPFFEPDGSDVPKAEVVIDKLSGAIPTGLGIEQVTTGQNSDI